MYGITGIGETMAVWLLKILQPLNLRVSKVYHFDFCSTELYSTLM